MSESAMSPGEPRRVVPRAGTDPTVRIALAGDTMLGRGVAKRLADDPSRPLVSPEVVEAANEDDLGPLNLGCSISERGHRWSDPAKPLFFRAPPVAIDTLARLQTSCAVTLANNQALDYGSEALVDTFFPSQPGRASPG
jgi:hypothetical protein